jgi:hypothetical protein
MRTPEGKSYIVWRAMREWCKTHPQKQGMISTPDGEFFISFTPKGSRLKGAEQPQRLYVDFK